MNTFVGDSIACDMCFTRIARTDASGYWLYVSMPIAQRNRFPVASIARNGNIKTNWKLYETMARKRWSTIPWIATRVLCCVSKLLCNRK